MAISTKKVEGMHCDGRANRVKNLLEKEPGVREAEVSYRRGEARLKYNEHTVAPDRLFMLVEQAGYTARKPT